MDKVIVISKCSLIKGGDVHFHFLGFWKGKRISRVIVRSFNNHVTFSLGEVYLLYLTVCSLDSGFMFTELVRYKHIQQ